MERKGKSSDRLKSWRVGWVLGFRLGNVEKKQLARSEARNGRSRANMPSASNNDRCQFSEANYKTRQVFPLCLYAYTWEHTLYMTIHIQIRKLIIQRNFAPTSVCHWDLNFGPRTSPTVSSESPIIPIKIFYCEDSEWKMKPLFEQVGNCTIPRC